MVAVALTVFGWDLASEPHFIDESAYISQSFFADLWLNGQRDDPAWLTYAGYDLPPLPKYLIGASLRAGGYRRPGPSTVRDWYENTSRRFVSDRALTVARIPSVLLGVIGCLAIYALGTMAGDRRVGLLVALLLLTNPLYQLHARRAMSDVPAEALILSTMAVGLWAWRRLLAGRGTAGPALGLAVGSGMLCGLATLSKLNGVLSGFVLGGWAILALPLRSSSVMGRALVALATVVAGGVAFGTFALLNPFLYAQPRAALEIAYPRGPLDPPPGLVARMSFSRRIEVVYDHRSGVSNVARQSFPLDALNTSIDRIKAVAVQGFGRFGPFGPRGRSDSTVRYSWDQDRGACLWLPWVALGLVAATARGRAQLRAGEPPAAWAIVVQSVVALAVVTAFIPLAWDRYFLSIQPGSALLGAIGAVEGYDRLRRAFVGKPRPESLP